MPADTQQNDSAQAAINMFACYCSFQCEGYGDPPLCRDCGTPMRKWGERIPARRSTVIENATAADKRTANGGY